LKLKCGEPLSNCAFNFNLRHYNLVWGRLENIQIGFFSMGPVELEISATYKFDPPPDEDEEEDEAGGLSHIENNHSLSTDDDDESGPPPTHMCMSICSEGKSCSVLRSQWSGYSQ